MNLDKLQTLGVPVTDAYNTLQTFLGRPVCERLQPLQPHLAGADSGRARVSQPALRHRSFLRSQHGRKHGAAGHAGIRSSPRAGPDVVFRYNRFRAIQILGGPARGVSSGQAIDVMEKVAAETLPPGYGYEWTGTTYQAEAGAGTRRRDLRVRHPCWFSCVWRRCMKAGRSRWRCCFRCRWAFSARCWPCICAIFPMTFTPRSAL